VSDSRNGEGANDRQPFMRAYGIYLVQLLAIVSILIATYTMRLWLLLLVPPAAVIAVVSALLWNPYPSPSLKLLDKARRARRLRLGFALAVPLGLITLSFLPIKHSPLWTLVPWGTAMVIAQRWPDKRWPITRATDPVEA
jgi:hypothetical protein